MNCFVSVDDSNNELIELNTAATLSANFHSPFFDVLLHFSYVGDWWLL